MGRVSSWKHAKGEQSTQAALGKLLEPFAENLIEANTKVYPSASFVSPPDRRQLDAWKPLIDAAMALDPRGGHFDNHDVAAGVRIACDSQSLQSKLDSIAAMLCRPHADLLDHIAVQVRVMLSHARRPQSSSSGASSSKKVRLNPFILFRTPDDESEPEMDEEEKTVVSTYWDGASARLLRSNGEEEEAMCRSLEREAKR